MNLLRKRTERGLTGVKLVIADDPAGLKAAVRSHLPMDRLQRCVVPLTRNALPSEGGVVVGKAAGLRAAFRGEGPKSVAG